MNDPIAFTIHPAGWYALAFLLALYVASIVVAYRTGRSEGREDERRAQFDLYLDHDTTIADGVWDGEEWAHVECSCGWFIRNLPDRSAAIVAASEHRQDAS